MASFKVTVVGDSGVGKTSLICRLVQDKFSCETSSTIGASFSTYYPDIKLTDAIQIPQTSNTYTTFGESTSLKTRLSLGLLKSDNQDPIYRPAKSQGIQHWRHDPNRMKFEIWDTAGQERFNTLVPLYLRGTDCILLIFDSSKSVSFDNCKKKWMSLIYGQFKLGDSNFPLIVLIENKIDLQGDESRTEEASEFARENNFLFWRTSAKDGIGIIHLFNELAKIFSQRTPQKEKEQQSSTETITLSQQRAESTRQCTSSCVS
jgi:small GTP-binding protein